MRSLFINLGLFLLGAAVGMFIMRMIELINMIEQLTPRS